MAEAARYSIGIDLGTTNCALAWVSLEGGAGDATEVLRIPQWESVSSLTDASTLPSFLYRPPEAERERMGERGGDWIAGRWARAQAALVPGRVVHSAKSWLACHGMDRTARFLPWGTADLPAEERLSPIEASARLLGDLRDAWNAAMPAAPFAAQQIAVTVPASFDAAAQRLTLTAAEQAGYPAGVRLLEEPQAAFYRWLEAHEMEGSLETQLEHLRERPHHVLIVDVGGGTSDFSLFEIKLGKRRKLPEIRRVAVSDHILLGGDNMDLALAHVMEARLQAQDSLAPDQWAQLVAQCQQAKEASLAPGGPESFEVALAGRGSSLLGATLRAGITRDEVMHLLLDGFYPDCAAGAVPERASGALREMGLPFAADSAVTRHLADFLRDLPPVDAILFNGGSLDPAAVRDRLRAQVETWQDDTKVIVLENPEPALAVARGAARYGLLTNRNERRIQAGAARSLYVEAASTGKGKRLVCVLPKGTAPETEILVDPPDLRLRVHTPVQFRVYASTRRGKDVAGQVVKLDDRNFQALPPLQTLIRPEDSEIETIPVELSSRLNALGLLQVECLDPAHPETRWPLEFNLTAGETELAVEEAPTIESGVSAEREAEAGARIRTLFGQPWDKRDPLTPARLVRSLEKILDLPKQDWNAALLRGMWPTLHGCFHLREHSYDHEETWVSLAGLLLRPGYGVQLDASRMDQLWEFQEDGFWYPGKAMQLNADVLWRRVAGGLSAERQETLLADALRRIEQATKKPPAEAVRLAGALERVAPERKARLAGLLLERVLPLAGNGGYAEPFLVSLTRLLSRAPLYGGAETVLPPEEVERAFEALRPLDWTAAHLGEVKTLFLRAARLVDNRALDLPRNLRQGITAKLRQADVAGPKLIPLEQHVPLQQSDRVSLFGESLPAGLVLDG